jgi:hypothetical protein
VLKLRSSTPSPAATLAPPALGRDFPGPGAAPLLKRSPGVSGIKQIY